MMFGSVCSGIEAASVAWEPIGWKAAWFAEIEPFPSAVLAHRFPEVENLGDMTTLARRVLAGAIAAPDVLTGGTPCQAFSVAGMREGLNDPRGALTIKFVELANAIDHVRAQRGEAPAVVIWENVPGVLSDKGNAFGCFLGALAGEDCELQPSGKRWTDAGCVYGPQRAIAWRTLDAQYFGLAQRRRRVFVVASARNDLDPAAVLFEREGVRRDTPPRRGAGQDAAGCPPDSLAFGGGNTSGPIDPAACLTAKGMRQDFEVETFVVHGTQDPDVRHDQAHTLKAEGFDAIEDGTGRGRGQPIVPVGFDTCATLDARTTGGGFPGTDGACGGHVIPSASAVRRLTPRECEALQGFPPDWTLIPWRKKPAEECPDGPRYKAIGNSWAVPVARWVGLRVQRALEVLQ